MLFNLVPFGLFHAKFVEASASRCKKIKAKSLHFVVTPALYPEDPGSNPVDSFFILQRALANNEKGPSQTLIRFIGFNFGHVQLLRFVVVMVWSYSFGHIHLVKCITLFQNVLNAPSVLSNFKARPQLG